MLPKGQPLQKQPFARLGALGANQLGRHFHQFPPAAEPCHGQHTHCVTAHNHGAERPIEHQPDLRGKIVHNGISLPDHTREDDRAHEHAQNTAKQGGAAGISQVFCRDGSAIPQSFHHTDLRPLLVHHLAHGGNAHQSRHQEEKQRKHPAHAFYNLRIAFKAGVRHIGIPVQHIDIRLRHIRQRLPALLQLLFGLIQLFLGVGQLLLRAGPIGFICLPALGKLLPAFFQLLRPGFQHLAVFIQLGLRLVQLQTVRLNGCLRPCKLIRRLISGGLQLTQSVLDLRKPILHLVPLGFQLLFPALQVRLLRL